MTSTEPRIVLMGVEWQDQRLRWLASALWSDGVTQLLEIGPDVRLAEVRSLMEIDRALSGQRLRSAA